MSKEQDLRISDLEQQVHGIENMLNNIMSMYYNLSNNTLYTSHNMLVCSRCNTIPQHMAIGTCQHSDCTHGRN